jgi:3-deoxy-7-phosphoheptulonate synthase
MIVKMKPQASLGEASGILEAVGRLGFATRRVSLPFGTFVVGLGSGRCDLNAVASLPGAEWARRAGEGPVLASFETSPTRTVVPLGQTGVGGEYLSLMAGPCSVEDQDQIRTCARFVASYGASVLRGGAYKPRTSPYSFQGLGLEGLRMLMEAGRATGLPVVTEVMDPGELEAMLPFVDCFQIGARSMQNFPLLREAGRAGRPVLLKRGSSASINELLMAAEYILLEGNAKVILCERGIKTFETATRNTLDLNAVPVLKAQTHLPVIVDPSHGTGRRDAVIAMARAAVAAGADGLMVEVHPDPDRALSDGDQSLTPAEFRRLVEEIGPVAEAIGRRVFVPGAAPFGRAAGRHARATGWGSAG